ncbi:4Fe-4S binding protein [Neptuniibacter caesariensis]|uniref:4Fe-4S ferredoxin, iron-sulfur binding n=1 Tax=Neptuniibacter caesariensis TaxID=207954 RepID=A0A7U8C7U3_NEPCE|nr:4Fe-4S binding protein [Neptuniibacter caesariensis]EAR61809.1 4Fe-4S ferredoxin, iron-sulfur binding [Neptuniibacter caesariensis]
MNSIMNLTVLRRAVQLFMFILLVYGSVVVGFYAADKISGALPSLSCAYDQMNADYCALIPLQHQFHHRLGAAVDSGNWFTLLMPVLTTMATFFIMFIILNKAFCGWVCPLGFFQEVMQLIGQKLGLRKVDSLSHDAVDKVRPVKWLMLGGLVFGLPALTSLGFLSDEWGDPFCQICPSRILTTLLSADTDQIFVDTSTPSYMFLSILGDFLFGLTLALAMTLRQPFCRICPMLALHAVFRKLGLARLVKKGTSRCDKCGLCAEACPMDIRELQSEFNDVEKTRDITLPDCTLCGRCVEFCPDKDVLQLRYLNIPVFSADPKYFKKRKKAQKHWDEIKLINLDAGKKVRT